MFNVKNCKRCLYQWGSRLPTDPVRCPNCGNTKWWLEAGACVRGRPHKYGIDKMLVGEHSTWEYEGANYVSMFQTINNYGRRHKKVFEFENHGLSFSVKRVK